MSEKLRHGNMALKKTAVSIGSTFPGEVSRQHAESVGLGEWQISDSTIAEIERIESSIRIAEMQSGRILVG